MFDKEKIKAINDALQGSDLQKQVYLELLRLNPGPAEEGNWTQNQVTVKIAAEQPIHGLIIFVTFPNPVQGHSRIAPKTITKEVLIHPNGCCEGLRLNIPVKTLSETRKLVAV